MNQFNVDMKCGNVEIHTIVRQMGGGNAENEAEAFNRMQNCSQSLAQVQFVFIVFSLSFNSTTGNSIWYTAGPLLRFELLFDCSFSYIDVNLTRNFNYDK